MADVECRGDGGWRALRNRARATRTVKQLQWGGAAAGPPVAAALALRHRCRCRPLPQTAGHAQTCPQTCSAAAWRARCVRAPAPHLPLPPPSCPGPACAPSPDRRQLPRSRAGPCVLLHGGARPCNCANRWPAPWSRTRRRCHTPAAQASREGDAEVMLACRLHGARGAGVA